MYSEVMLHLAWNKYCEKKKKIHTKIFVLRKLRKTVPPTARSWSCRGPKTGNSGEKKSVETLIWYSLLNQEHTGFTAGFFSMLPDIR